MTRLSMSDARWPDRSIQRKNNASRRLRSSGWGAAALGSGGLGCPRSQGAGPDGEVVTVATRDVFSAEELARLRGFPEITRAELIRYFTLTRSDEAFVRKFHGGANVLGASV